MSFLTIKAKLYAFGAILLAAVAFFVRLKFVTHQRDRAVEKAERAEAQAHVEKIVREKDAEIYSEHSDLEREAREAIKRGEVPDNLRNPNDF